METGPWLKVSSDRLVKPGIEPATPGLQGKRFIRYTTAVSSLGLCLDNQVKEKQWKWSVVIPYHVYQQQVAPKLPKMRSHRHSMLF